MVTPPRPVRPCAAISLPAWGRGCKPDAGPREARSCAPRRRRIRESTEESLRIEEGALYPALHRLERDGLVEPSWGPSENNRRAKYYALTSEGRRRLARERERWVEHTLAVSKLLEVGLELA
jgi:predicted ArsR family transcriptional regulator